MSEKWRTEVTAQDYFGHQKKTLALADRRPLIRKASDLVGPGIAASAVRVTDWNDTLAMFNGFYSSDVGAANAPTTAGAFVGTVVSDAELGGAQTLLRLDTNAKYHRTFQRHPDDPNKIYWSAWVTG